MNGGMAGVSFCGLYGRDLGCRGVLAWLLAWLYSLSLFASSSDGMAGVLGLFL